jgi:hypothetical protein
MSIDECRIKEFFLFYFLKIAERSDIHHSSIDIHHSSFEKVSGYGNALAKTNKSRPAHPQLLIALW